MDNNELKQLAEQTARLNTVSRILRDAITFCEAQQNAAASEDFRKTLTWLERAEKQMCGEHEPAIRRELMNLPPKDAPTATPSGGKAKRKPISEMTAAEYEEGLRQAWNRELTMPITGLTEFVTKVASLPLSSETGEEPSKFDRAIEAAREFVVKVKP